MRKKTTQEDRILWRLRQAVKFNVNDGWVSNHQFRDKPARYGVQHPARIWTLEHERGHHILRKHGKKKTDYYYKLAPRQEVTT